MFITRFGKVRLHEMQRWVFIVLYAALYFTIEAVTKKNNIEFYIWDTALTATLVTLAIFIGNLFCGWGCFLWRFQDLADLIGRFFLRKRYNSIIPERVKDRLRFVKFLVLGVSIIIPTALGSYALFLKFWGWALMAGLIISLFDSHAYCKYFCMNGALFKLAALLNRKILVRDKEVCINCNLCTEVCLHDCSPAKKETSINKDLWCTSCFRCKAVCPVNAISYKETNNK
jgi:polyferredoxin